MSGQGVLEALVGILGEALSPFADRLQGEQAKETLEQLGL